MVAAVALLPHKNIMHSPMTRPSRQFMELACSVASRGVDAERQPGARGRRAQVLRGNSVRYAEQILSDGRPRACPADHGTGSRSQILIEARSMVPRKV